jgi:hypothetical protein
MSEIPIFVPISRRGSTGINSIVPVAIFCGIGMLASLLMLICDQDHFIALSYF